MPEPVTRPGGLDPLQFLQSVADPRRRAEALELCELMRDVTGEEPVMWGPSIVGFGSTSYRYASGRTGTTATLGFSPRKAQLVVYLMDGYDDDSRRADLQALGPHSTGKACLYLKRLDAVDRDVLRRILADSFATTRARTMA